jgi:hypothetical protein
MKSLIRTTALLLILVIIAGAAIAAPRLTINDSMFDFGYVPQNSKVSHIFWLYSTGDDSLKIVRVTPG